MVTLVKIPFLPSRHSGFTLLELLIAIAVFSLVSVMSYSGLKTVIDSNNHIQLKSDQYQQLDRLFLLMQQDFYQMIDRPVRDAFGDPQPALIANGGSAGFFLEFTRAGALNIANPQVPLLRRVAYLLDNGIVKRRSWQVLDRLQSSEFLDVELLDNVADMEVSFFYDDWKTQIQRQNVPSGQGLPKAIAISLVVEGIGSIRRVWAVTL
ncbi:MAG: type II secretion system minor pseudopilin GspJ [Gammaproteobacteria bacterium]|nr:type II secretion system minor pseudopilin GspJ [Gammaproteobacteria bacterium]